MGAPQARVAVAAQQFWYATKTQSWLRQAYPGLLRETANLYYTMDVKGRGRMRIDDFRAAAQVAKNRRAKVRTLVVPGSGLVKKQAAAEGLDKIFTDAGMEWREPGCSMCVAMNGDMLASGERSASTSNRNFRGRQGLGSRTHLVSPAMAAAASVTGYFTDVRKLIQED